MLKHAAAYPDSVDIYAGESNQIKLTYGEDANSIEDLHRRRTKSDMYIIFPNNCHFLLFCFNLYSLVQHTLFILLCYSSTMAREFSHERQIKYSDLIWFRLVCASTSCHKEYTGNSDISLHCSLWRHYALKYKLNMTNDK